MGGGEPPPPPANGCNAAPSEDPDKVRFCVEIENRSHLSTLPTPFAPGVWAIHGEADLLFGDGEADRGEGLEALAEDGNPGPLAEALAAHADVASSGVFNTPAGADGPAPIFPGERYAFTVDVERDGPNRLSLATMIVQSNDRFVPVRDLPLFEGGEPVQHADLSASLAIWDSGTEADEIPGAGPQQAPRQAGPDTGRAEGTVGLRTDPTRSVPFAGDVVAITAAQDGSSYTFTVENRARGAIETPVAPVFWALHDASWSLFSDGEPASPGLEVLAEDGSPMVLVSEHAAAAGVGAAGAQPITDQRPDAEPGPSFPGESYTFTVNPTPEHPYLSFAAMLVQSNDVFIAPPAEGIALLDADGNPRDAAMINRELAERVLLWDAGTEANETIGAGRFQAPRQPGPNMGPADPMPGVRIYQDLTNDLADLSDKVDVQVAAQADGEWQVTINNVSGESAYPLLLTPTVWMVHGGDQPAFVDGEPATEGLELLAETGSFMTYLEAFPGEAGAMARPMGAEDPGPIAAGGAYQFVVTASAETPYLNFATMVVPTNDTFLSLGTMGVPLYDADGNPRADEDINADVAAALSAWDSGTEINEIGAAGSNQPPRAGGRDDGLDEDLGVVRAVTAEDDPFNQPSVDALLDIRVTPL